MEIASFVLSIISIIISVGLVIYEITKQKKINDINLESSFFIKIFQEYLIDKFPKARLKINFANNKLSDIDDLQKLLIEIRQSSLYYKYSDEDFYNTLKTHCQNLEDHIVKNEDKSVDQAEFWKDFENHSEMIYTCVNEKLKNGSINR